MNSQLATTAGALRYEFLMQVRRPAMWITFVVFVGLLLLLENHGSTSLGVVIPNWVAHYPMLQVLANWAFTVNTSLPIIMGALLADRLPRDRRTKVSEMLVTYAAPQGARLAGKFSGALLATLVPMLIAYYAGVIYIAGLAHNAAALLLAPVPFAVIALPGLLFVTAFSLALPAVLPTPLYIFGFVGYWYWDSLWFHADFPNLGRTILSPIGQFMLKGIFGEIPTDSGPSHPEHLTATVVQGFASMALLAGIALIVMILLDRYLSWRQASQ